MTDPTKYVVVYEWAGSNYSAYVPDLPGCIAVGDTLEETEGLMREAIQLHLEELRAHGDPIPRPQTVTGYVEVG